MTKNTGDLTETPTPSLENGTVYYDQLINVAFHKLQSSIRNQVKDLLETDGNSTVPASQVIAINEDGSVVMKVPTQMQIAMKLQSWAMSKKGGDSLKAIQMIMEQIDGKAKETKDINLNTEQPLFE